MRQRFSFHELTITANVEFDLQNGEVEIVGSVICEETNRRANFSYARHAHNVTAAVRQVEKLAEKEANKLADEVYRFKQLAAANRNANRRMAYDNPEAEAESYGNK